MGKVVRRGEGARNLAIEIVRCGGTFEEAAAASGFKPDYVRQICAKAGVYIPSKRKGINKAKIEAERKKKAKEDLYANMREYKAQGHTNEEVAQVFNVPVSCSVRVCAGIAPQRARPKRHKNQWQSRDMDRYAADCVKSKQPHFEYVGNYTGSDGTADVRCLTCGTVQTKSWVTIRHAGRMICEHCIEQERQRKAELKEQRKKHKQSEELRRRKEASFFVHSFVQLELSVCPECGGLFVSGNGRVYCSSKCLRRVSNKRRKDKRLRKIKNVVIDKDIELKALAERDNDVCWLCGGAVDWLDFTNEDAFIAGDNYPSIDHVVPISKGGTHAWDNVRLAHRRCNYLKNDSIMCPPCDNNPRPTWGPVRASREKQIPLPELDQVAGS